MNTPPPKSTMAISPVEKGPATPPAWDIPDIPASQQPSSASETRKHRVAYLLIGLIVALALAVPLIRTENFFALHQTAGDFTEGSARFQLTFGFIFTVAGIFCLKYSAAAWDTVKYVNWCLWLFLLWCVLTIGWSPYPIVSAKRVIQQIGLVLLGLTLTLPFVHQEFFQRTLWWTLALLLMASLLSVVLLPQMSVDSLRDNAWRGIMWHKNTLGTVAAFSVLTWLQALDSRWVSRSIGILGLLLALAMLIMAKSSTALLSAGVGCGAWMLARRQYVAGQHLRYVALLGLVAVTCIGLLVFQLVAGRLPSFSELSSPVSWLFHKSTDLTGRTELWDLVMLEVRQHLWTGIGYGAFWLNVGSPSQYIIDALGWIPLQAHNGYLDLLNETGVIGLTLALAVLAVHAGFLVRLSLAGSHIAPFHWALLAMIVTSNFSEGQLFNGVMFQNALLLMSIVVTAREMATLRTTATHATNLRVIHS